jgi:hypothetical protein
MNICLFVTLFYACKSEQTLYYPPPFVYGPTDVEDLPLEFNQDVFLQPIGRPADILFVIDKSCSMADNNLNLNNNISMFFEVLDQYNIDYHIGLTSMNGTDNAGKFVNLFGSNYIKPGDSDNALLFSMMNNLLSDDIFSDGESGLDAVYGAMVINLEDHPDFFRSDVPLYIIVISDENDSSTHLDPKGLYQKLYSWEGQENKKVYFSGIISLGSNLCEDLSSTVGERYFGLIKHFQGQTVDICNQDWGGALNDLALLATPDFKNEYFLSRLPVVETIKIQTYHNDIVFTYENVGDFFYYENKNSVLILNGYQPVDGDLVDIFYQIK